MMFKVGIIGCGRMASSIEDQAEESRRDGRRATPLVMPYCHAGGYTIVEETEMVAGCDISEERLSAFQKRWNVPRGYTDFRELIDKEKPDILSITTRPEQHAEAMIYGAEHGVKGMYAEKPLCCSLVEADAIRDAFERNGVFLEYGPWVRSSACYRQARDIATSGELGDVKSVLGFSGKSCNGHTTDALLYLLGDPNPVSIQGTLDELHPVEGDTANMRFLDAHAPIRSAFVEFDNGTSLRVAGVGIQELELYCERGIIRIQNVAESLYVRKTDGSSRCYDPIEVKPVTHWSNTERKIRELVESIKTGKAGVSNLRATMLGTEIGFGLYESHLQGGIAVRPPIPNRERWVSSW